MAKKNRRSPVSRDKRFKQRTTSDYGTPERWQHSDHTLEYTDAAGIFAIRVCEPHILDHLLNRNLLDAQAHDAGLKLLRDYHGSGIEARVTASYTSMRGAKADAEARLLRNEMEEAAYQRWRNALRMISVPMRDVVIHVACLGYAPRVAQLNHLRDGLLQLAKYYGLVR